jgi:hypothetical protein
VHGRKRGCEGEGGRERAQGWGESAARARAQARTLPFARKFFLRKVRVGPQKCTCVVSARPATHLSARQAVRCHQRHKWDEGGRGAWQSGRDLFARAARRGGHACRRARGGPSLPKKNYGAPKALTPPTRPPPPPPPLTEHSSPSSFVGCRAVCKRGASSQAQRAAFSWQGASSFFARRAQAKKQCCPSAPAAWPPWLGAPCCWCLASRPVARPGARCVGGRERGVWAREGGGGLSFSLDGPNGGWPQRRQKMSSPSPPQHKQNTTGRRRRLGRGRHGRVLGVSGPGREF